MITLSYILGRQHMSVAVLYTALCVWVDSQFVLAALSCRLCLVLAGCPTLCAVILNLHWRLCRAALCVCVESQFALAALSCRVCRVLADCPPLRAAIHLCGELPTRFVQALIR